MPIDDVHRRSSCLAWAAMAQVLREGDCRVLSVDFNPDLVRNGDAMGHPVLYGDAEDSEFIGSMPFAHVQWVVSTVSEQHINRSLIQTLHGLGYSGRIAETAHGSGEVGRLEQAGADLVMVPYQDASREAATRLMGQVSSEVLHFFDAEYGWEFAIPTSVNRRKILMYSDKYPVHGADK